MNNWLDRTADTIYDALRILPPVLFVPLVIVGFVLLFVLSLLLVPARDWTDGSSS